MSEEHIVRITNIESVTHDVRRYQVEKPQGYTFKPGQATEVAINKEGWKEERRPFTFTSLNTDPYLEFTIKSYNDHPGVTNELGKLKVGDELIIHDVWGVIEYKGPGYFIAGGAGITRRKIPGRDRRGSGRRERSVGKGWGSDGDAIARWRSAREFGAAR